jgi:predicted dehydrogenase
MGAIRPADEKKKPRYLLLIFCTMMYGERHTRASSGRNGQVTGVDMHKTRWAMVGTGLMLELIGRDLARTENLEASVLVSRSQERAEAAAKEYGFAEGSGDFSAVLERDDIDVVYVATPHSEHFPLAMAAIDAGKHVLVEKAMTPNAALTRELCEHAQAQGVFAMEAMWTNFNPVFQGLRQAVADGAVGEPRLLFADFSSHAPYDPNWRLWAKDTAGGSTLDQAVYTLSAAHTFFGVPKEITVVSTVEHDVDAEVVVTLDFADGQRAVCVSGLRAFSPRRGYIGGTCGYVETHDDFWRPTGYTVATSHHDSYTRQDVTFPKEGNGYVPMLRAVSQAVMDGKTEHELRSHADTIAVAEIMDEVLRQVHKNV